MHVSLTWLVVLIISKAVSDAILKPHYGTAVLYLPKRSYWYRITNGRSLLWDYNCEKRKTRSLKQEWLRTTSGYDANMSSPTKWKAPKQRLTDKRGVVGRNGQIAVLLMCLTAGCGCQERALPRWKALKESGYTWWLFELLEC